MPRNIFGKPSSWPHQFAPTGKNQQGEWGTMLAQTRCVWCGKEYWVGGGPKPTGACPERTDQSELRRLGVE